MSQYAVEVTDSALAAISTQARYISLECEDPLNAQCWIEQVWDAVESLEQWPFRAAKAAEDSYVAYEVRQLVVGSHLLLFTVDDEHKVVTIIGVRHGHRQLHLENLPPEGSSADESDK